MDPKTTGQFISFLRKEKGMTQKQLSEKLNLSDKAISRWETGRGFPDIESLQALSNEFYVSINELLYGKRIQTRAMAQNAEKDIASTYIKTNEKKQHMLNISIGLAITLVVVIILSTLAISALYREVMGDDNCVIASDYSYLTLYGKRYVPLVLEGNECMLSECLISEAQVEDAPFIGKLFFGDKLYSVKQCENNDIVYLQTEYDFMISNYYCVEGKVEKYKEMSQEAVYDQWTAEIYTKDWTSHDLKMDNDLEQMLINSNYKKSLTVNCDWSRGDGDEAITVYCAQTEGPFRRTEGELIRKQGEYYWFDYDDIPETQNNGDFSKIKAYEISNAYDEELDLLFSYMFK